MDLKTLIDKNHNDLAFIVGNGINRYQNLSNTISWDALLIQLWAKFSVHTVSKIPEGISYTEFYDLLDIEVGHVPGQLSSIQKEVSTLLQSWEGRRHHTAFLAKAQGLKAPVLTTNFDLTLTKALGLQQFHTDAKSFTDYYPWTTYYGHRTLASPIDDFGVWFINGCIRYHRSIRLGLSHYMGSVEKARTLIHKGGDKRLLSGKDPEHWQGKHTWLQIIFNKSLCIFGLGLEENETFLRWLMIERAKYFKTFPERKKDSWYCCIKPSSIDAKYLGKKYFLERIGFEVIEMESYEGIYERPWEI